MNAQEARVEGEHGSHRFKFEHCVIATGAGAAPVPGLSYDGKQVLTPEQALMLPELPAALDIAGDDYIALELATLFARVGVKVKLFSPGEQLLAEVDPVALRLVQAGFGQKSVQNNNKTRRKKRTRGPLRNSGGGRPPTPRAP